MPLEHAVLAFLNDSPLTGYGLKKYLDQSVGHFWTSTQSHIYKALDEIEQKGWAVAQTIPQIGRPNRNEYHITPEGRAELYRWLTTPIPPSPVREGWLVQLYFSQDRTNEEIIAVLEARSRAIQEAVDALDTIQEQVDVNRGPAYQAGQGRTFEIRSLTLDFGRSYYRSELRWLQNAIERVRSIPQPGSRSSST